MTDRTRILDLMADRATEGLASASQDELDGLLASEPGSDSDLLEYAAAAIDLACADSSSERFPDSLRAKLLADAGSHFGHNAGPSS